jgi:hypothetical protein
MMRLLDLFRPRSTVEPQEVRIGHRIVCSDGRVREVDVLDYTRRNQDIYRFTFTDDHWIEYGPGQKATVVR